ncbi:MAG: nuclear transport factor 2 family protein [Filomicrobium sp.]
MGMDQDAKLAEVLAVNEHFYDVFRSGDFAAMDEMWSRREDVSVYHPDWPGITGREDVMASWHRLMISNDPPAVFVRDPMVVREGRVAVVFCFEDVEGSTMTASNVFVKEDGVWKITSHHARPLPQLGEGSDDDEAGDAGGTGDGAA